MKAALCWGVVAVGVIGMIAGAAAENDSGLAPLTQTADTTPPDYLLKTCDEVPSAGGAVTAMNGVDPAAWLVGTVLTKNGRQVSAEEFEALKATVKLTQLRGITHGRLIPHSPDGRVVYEYSSEPGYVGKDQAIFMAEFEGKRYKIIANVVVSMTINENSPQCRPPQLIKVNGKPVSGSSSYELNTIPVAFADLTGSALVQTFGTNMTLDTTAASPVGTGDARGAL